jgi:trans-aconitate 2-methyltransferase
VVTNAVLQWVPGHLDLLPAWLAALPSRAWFALQVPGNFGAPSHALVRELAAGRVTLRGEAAVPEPDAYAEVLAGCGADVDVWETTYHQRLTGPDPVLHWIGATALRPVRDALPPEEYAAFRAELAPRLRAAYPAGPDGTTWFPFRRIFAVARTR